MCRTPWLSNRNGFRGLFVIIMSEMRNSLLDTVHALVERYEIEPRSSNRRAFYLPPDFGWTHKLLKYASTTSCETLALYCPVSKYTISTSCPNSAIAKITYSKKHQCNSNFPPFSLVGFFVLLFLSSLHMFLSFICFFLFILFFLSLLAFIYQSVSLPRSLSVCLSMSFSAPLSVSLSTPTLSLSLVPLPS